MAVAFGDMGACSARFRAGLAAMVGDEAAAVEAAVGRPLSVTVSSGLSLGIPLSRARGTVFAEVLRTGEDAFEIILNPAALDGPETWHRDEVARSCGEWRPAARDLASRHWLMSRVLTSLNTPPAAGVYGDSWRARVHLDARAVSRAMARRFPRRSDYVEWVTSMLVAPTAAALAVPSRRESPRAILAHEFGHVWYEAARLPFGGDTRSSVAAGLAATMPPPVTTMGIGRPYESAAEAWAFHRTDPELMARLRPDAVAWVSGSPS